MTYIVMVSVAMAYTAMAYIGMSCIVMAFVVIAIAMAAIVANLGLSWVTLDGPARRGCGDDACPPVCEHANVHARTQVPGNERACPCGYTCLNSCPHACLHTVTQHLGRRRCSGILALWHISHHHILVIATY